ncbi:MAG: transcriptional repressor [Ectothiorhodospiraceae bacterium]|nr:transcriptional repressor [Chromatiales bacterium]MCP5154344.1 transcriptional repressor [Ectothiorhodospiraceae bacterium]
MDSTTSERVLSSFRSAGHDHRRCVQDALARAEQLCQARGARLTAIRRRILELVWQSHQPVLAYDLLDRLRLERARAAPPTVYRALEFLREHGLVHRIESLNAYVGCADPRREHAGQFLICDACGAVAELDDPEIGGLIEARARGAGFEPASQMVEVHGRCPRCRHGAPPAPVPAT